MLDGDHLQVNQEIYFISVSRYLYLIKSIPSLNPENTCLPCSRPSEDRTIPLSIIAERTKLTVEDVEYLLMKSLSVSTSNKFRVFNYRVLIYTRMHEETCLGKMIVEKEKRKGLLT